MNKSILYLITVSLFVVLFTSCSDDFLVTPVQGQFELDNFYTTEDGAYKAVIAAYSGLKQADLDGGQLDHGSLHAWCYFTFGDICSDDAEKGGGHRGDFGGAGDLAEFLGFPDSGPLWFLWKGAYEGVFRANLVIEKLPEMEINREDPAGYNLRDRYIAEAKFIRAYLYFYMVRVYGGVPLVDKLLSSKDFLMPRATTSEIYDFIKRDLEEAIPNLPEKSQYKPADMGRATKGAAKGLLAKVLVFESSMAMNYPNDERFAGMKQNWPKALSMAEEVINSGQYNLSTPVELIFRSQYENGPESIFEIQFKESGDGWHTFNTGQTFYTMQRCRGGSWPTPGEGWGFNQPSQNLVNTFEHGGDWGLDSTDWVDPRFESTIVYDGKPAFWDNSVILNVGEGNNRSQTGYLNHKVVLPPNEIPFNWSDAGGNLRILRYADLVLLAAEAAYFAGDEGKARTYLNMVRERARRSATHPNALPDITASGTALRDAIWKERRVELAMEGHRFYDVIRQGNPDVVMNEYYRTNPVTQLENPFKKGVHELFPIPLNQIIISGDALKQNPGYN